MARFEQLIEQHHDEIFAYLWRLLGKQRRADGAMEVDDLVQEVFLRAYRSFTSLRLDSNHRAWLYKIATHCAYNSLRQIRKRREGLLSLYHSAGEPMTVNDHPADGQNIEPGLHALLNRLPLKQRACVTLRYLQELDYPEIAMILNCSQETARANVYHALRRLRLKIEEEG